MATQKEVRGSDVVTPRLKKLLRNLACLFRKPEPAIVRDLSWSDAVDWLHKNLNERISVASELSTELNRARQTIKELAEVVYSPKRRVQSMQLHSLGIDPNGHAMRWCVKVNSYDVPSKLCEPPERERSLQVDLALDLAMIRATHDDVLPRLITRRIEDMGAAIGRRLVESKLKTVKLAELVAGSEREFGSDA